MATPSEQGLPRTFATGHRPAPMLEVVPQIDSLSEIEANRTAFVSALIERGLMSKMFADSGELGHFGYEVEHNLPFDSLIHILVGDHLGGAHHLRTIMDLEMPGRSMASKVGNRRIRDAQRLRSNGTYRPQIVAIQSNDGGQMKRWGSSQFPYEWNAEQVADAIISVAKSPSVKVDPDRHSFLKIGEVDGVRIQVAVDDKTGKIITGNPRI